MSTLYLLRHAKAYRPKSDMRDFERPLEETGRMDAAEIGAEMCRRGYVPTITICSSATRTRQTLEAVAAAADVGRAVFSDRLYSENAAGYLDLVHEHAEDGPILVVGHNPAIEDLAQALVGDGVPEARAALRLGFPTSGLAIIRFDKDLPTAGAGDGFLEAFHKPHR